MKNLIKLEYFYKNASQIAACFAVGSAVFMSYGLLAGLFIAPIDYQQKEAMRIMYIHVPSAILSLSVYTIIGIASFIYLIWKIKLADIIAHVSAPFGAAATVLALVTGALWGKPMWGTWWVWDARLTSELILLFLYFGYMGLRSAIIDQRVASTVSAILAVVGLIDIPIIHFSVDWWNTLHQGASISRFAKPAIDNAMLYPLLSVLVAMYMLYIVIVCIKARYEILWRERGSKWVKTLLEEQTGNA
ncbi:MAG TPA: heme ABC transporter permease [Gammaproteobacteria bacterium]|nr:heme ABC transporter permease [Gammaproteobacteria bacterium]